MLINKRVLNRSVLLVYLFTLLDSVIHVMNDQQINSNCLMSQGGGPASLRLGPHQSENRKPYKNKVCPRRVGRGQDSLRVPGTWGAWQGNPPHDPAQGRTTSCVALVLRTPAPHTHTHNLPQRPEPARPPAGGGEGAGTQALGS